MSSPYSVLKIRDFRLFIQARFCVTLATQIQATAVGWQIYQITKDPLSLGLIGLAEALPSIMVSLYAGHVADIIKRKKIILAMLSVLLICSLSLLFFVLPQGANMLMYGEYPIYCVIFISGIGRGFLTPALFSFMPQLIQRNQYQNAITWNSMLWEVASIGGPALGGLLIFNLKITYLFDAFLMVLGLILASMVGDKPLPTGTNELNVAEKIKSGLKFVFQNKIILGALSLDLFAVLFGGATSLLPIFATDILNVGEFGFGLLRAAPCLGALLMALYLAHRPIQKRAGIILLCAVGGFGFCMILFALSKIFLISIFLLFLSGGFDCISVIIRSTLLQTLTPENMKGRVSAVNNIFIGSSNEIGAFESGLVARYLGVISSVVVGGFLTIVVVTITAWRAPSLRKLKNVH